MAEPANELGLVEGVGGGLHAAHHGHVTEEGEELGGGGVDEGRGGLDLVALEGDAGLNGDRGLTAGGGGERAQEEEEEAMVVVEA